MKDKEMAEEWVSSAEYQRDRPIEPFCEDECSNDWAELAKYAEYMLPKAFLAGLKAVRHEHDDKLAKAKELLNACIIKARGNVNPSWSELITAIEQFLQEIE